MDNLAKMRQLTSLLFLAAGTLASKRPFSINDDVLAFPQYDVVFPEEYILQSEATTLLQVQERKLSAHEAPTGDDKSRYRDLDRHSAQKPLRGGGQKDGKRDDTVDWDSEALLEQYKYEEMTLDGLRYLCNIPRVSDAASETNTTSATENEDGGNKQEEENEIARATDRGLELLQEMEGTCMYYVSGWWSYSFCYKKQVKQFHALPAGPGVPSYPPREDPTTHSFILGKFQQEDEEGDLETDPTKQSKTEVAKLQTKGESRYLVQRLDGGTTCDLTGAERKIEVQFHCHPQTTDRIGWIKELTTCSYLMVIYTPRLCHDVAFQLPQPEDVHAIECREILAPGEVADFEAMKVHHESQKLVNSGPEEFPTVGGIQVGAMKQVGSEGRVIEKGRIASVTEDVVAIVAKRENGVLFMSPKEELKKLRLDPKHVEEFQKELDQRAKGKDWRLEIVIQSDEQSVFKVIIDANEDITGDGDESSEKSESAAKDSGKEQENNKHPKDDGSADEETGSEELFKEEL